MIQSIDRAAKVLLSLQGARHLGITDLASLLDLPPSTVHGIVKSLQAHGLVAKEPSGNRYMLGPALLKLSNVYLDTLDVRARSMRWTQELARRTELSIRLGVELFEEVIIINHDLRPDGSRQMPETGLSIPAHASAMGKLLLAYNPDQAKTLLQGNLISLTGDTITDPSELAAELELILERGIAIERDEAVLGESSVAAPVVDSSGAVIAAVALVLPSNEWPPSETTMNVLESMMFTTNEEFIEA
jgi:DNA-binding IclR family transcriptional regulator